MLRALNYLHINGIVHRDLKVRTNHQPRLICMIVPVMIVLRLKVRTNHQPKLIHRVTRTQRNRCVYLTFL